MARAHVHTTTPWEETDIMHSGFVGALGGMAIGLLLGFLLAGADPWGMQLDTGAIIGVTLFGTCFGAWLGGLRGGLFPQPPSHSLSGSGGAGRLPDDGRRG